MVKYSTPGIIDEDQKFTTKIAYDVSGNIEYIGEAVAGSATTSAVWRIKKLIYTTGDPTGILWADGNTNFDNVWDSHTSLDYS